MRPLSRRLQRHLSLFVERNRNRAEYIMHSIEPENADQLGAQLIIDPVGVDTAACIAITGRIAIAIAIAISVSGTATATAAAAAAAFSTPVSVVAPKDVAHISAAKQAEQQAFNETRQTCLAHAIASPGLVTRGVRAKVGWRRCQCFRVWRHGRAASPAAGAFCALF